MTSMTFNQPRNAGVLAKPLSVEGVADEDPDGHIPRKLLISGTRIVIPYWIDPVPNDELWVVLRQNGVERRLYTEFYPTPLTVPFLYFDLTAQDLATDGIAFLYYKIWKGSGGTDDPSPERQLTIDHTPLLTSAEPWFRHANRWGYLNNNTNPPLTSGATVVIPDFINIAEPGDVAKIHWRGYSSLNGSGPEVPGTYGVWEKILSAADIANGFDLVVPFRSHISLLFDDDSAVVDCELFRGRKPIAESKKGLVKIDRVTPGEIGPSGLNTQGETTMAVELVDKKQRPASTRTSGVGPFADISVDTLTDGYIAKSVLDSGTLTINLTRTPDELDEDEVDVKYRVKGGTFTDYDKTIKLGPVADRPVGTIPLPLPASLFPELPTPEAPTVYELMIQLFKGGGGNNEDSNTLEFVIDRTAPVNEKNPPKLVKPTPAPSFINQPVDTQRTVNETWMTANPIANFTVGVTYNLRRADDPLSAWLLAGAQKVRVWNAVVPASGAFSFPSSVLRQFPNGRINISYQWADHVGNIGEESAPTPVLILALAQPPLAKKAPLVPKTDPDYSTALYLDDFVSGITAIVENAYIEHAETGDKVYIEVEDPEDAANLVEIGPQPWANADLTFDLPYEDLAKIFGDADEPKDAWIRYRIERTGTTAATSPSRIISLAFDIVGTPLPVPPDLENRDMQLPVVTGASNTPNSLLPGDRDKPGKFKVTLALTDPDITPEHTVKCYLNNATTPFADFTPFGPVTEFEVPIPASVIAALPTPSVEARWTIQKSGVDKNVNKSFPQAVLVGGIPINLPLPTIRIRNQAIRDFIECYAMTSPTSGYVLGLQIPKGPLLPQGKAITAHFEAHRNAAGTDLIPGTAASAPYTIKDPATPDVAPVGGPANFKAAQPIRGAVAYGKYWYTTDINGQQSSVPVVKRLDTINTSFEYCDRAAAPGA
ncbi:MULTISPECIES: hypothetical protein [Pseudomonas]|uniref:hypothetical protein n=1 Tax=Pseudomonas TaxID=286 RepID=UPI000AFE8210|nr:MULTISPECIES: hypothetical protein [Pseudomonas]